MPKNCNAISIACPVPVGGRGGGRGGDKDGPGLMISLYS